MSVLETKGLKKRYGKFQALNGVDLAVEQGEIYGFIGPNGAGKTTTIRVLLGILRRSAGTAALFGRDVWMDAVDLHKRIAYVPGDVSLWGNLTGGEVIDLFVSLRGGNNKSRREEMIRRFALDPAKKCRTYSKGNRQKVALVAAFAAEADLYILDEPTSGLDPLMEQVFKECVREMKEQGKTVFLSSHILSEVEQLCDRVGIIKEGKVVETGTLAQLRHLRQTRVVLETETPLPGALPGVANRETDGAAEVFLIDPGHMDAFLKAVAPSGVTRLESAPPTLEELFMSRYEGGAEK